MVNEFGTRDRPLIMSAASVLAILDGTKTQTRRVAKLHPFDPAYEYVEEDGRFYLRHPSGRSLEKFCPMGDPGDRLWVRETFRIVPWTAYARSEGVQQTRKPDLTQPDGYDNHDAAVYKAGWDRGGSGVWKSSIHMPRWASRITLVIEAVSVERLHAITDADCCQELGAPGSDYPGSPQEQSGILRDTFRAHWEQINGMRGGASWQDNPPVWVITFRRHVP